MGLITLSGNPPIEVHLRRSSQARRLSLRLSRLDGRVTLTVPRYATEREARAFAKEKEAWLRAHLEDQPSTEQVAFGTMLPVEGEMLCISPGTGRRVYRDGDAICVPGQGEQVGPKLRAWLRTLARDRLAEASDRHAATLGRTYTKLTLRDTRSRWGSCTEAGALMYSWRLILAPRHVLDYVAAHEVAHLVEMNHSPDFWAEVTRAYGNWRPARDWLRTEGAGLHRYQFGD